MKHQLMLGLWILLLLVPSAGLAQPEAETSLRDLILLGIESNFGLQASQMEVPISRAEQLYERAAFDPQLFIDSSFSKTETPLASSLSLSTTSDTEQWSGEVGLRKRFSSGLSGSLSLMSDRLEQSPTTDTLNPSYHTGLLLDLTQPLLRDAGPDVNLTGVELAGYRNRQASLGYLQQVQNFAADIVELNLQLSAAEQAVALGQEAVQLAEQTLQGNQRRLDLGVIPISEVQEAQTALADRQLRLSKARQQRELLVQVLRRRLGLQLPPDYHAYSGGSQRKPEPPSLPDLSVLFQQARQKRPDLLISEIDQKSTALEKDYYQNQLKPRLDLLLQAGISGLSGNQDGALPSGDYAGDWFDASGSMLSADGYQFRAGLQFSMPLGNRQAEARLQQSHLRQRSAGYLTQDLEIQVRSELDQQLISLKRSYEQLIIAETFESLARLSLQQEQRRLEEGLSDTFRILSFQDKMIDARIGRIDANREYRRNQNRMQLVRGTILDDYGITVKLDENGVDHVQN